MSTSLALRDRTALLQATGGGASLDLRTVDPQEAERVGCSGATYVLAGRTWQMYGTAEVLGTSRRVPGWTRGVVGVRVRFTPAVLDPDTGTDVVTGYVNAQYVR